MVEGEESKVEEKKESDKSSNQEIQKSNDDITPDDFEIEKPEIAKIVNLEIEKPKTKKPASVRKIKNRRVLMKVVHSMKPGTPVKGDDAESHNFGNEEENKGELKMEEERKEEPEESDNEEIDTANLVMEAEDNSP